MGRGHTAERLALRWGFLLLMAGAMACRSGAAAPPPAPAPPPVPVAAGEFQKGVCYAHAWRWGGDDGYGSETSRRTLERLHKLGVRWLSLTPFGFMPGADSTTIRYAQHRGGESDARLAEEARHAHALGMRVVLKPHLWIRHGAWQGDLAWHDDATYRQWFDSYREFTLHFAALAAREKFDLFVIGTELKSATRRDPAGWRALVAEVRKVYSGPLTYAANWDEADDVKFWGDLDYVGVNAYAPLVSRPGASLADLKAGWQRVAGQLEALARRTGKRILLTEVGYRAVRDAAMTPSSWPERDDTPAYDPAHQADCYRATFEVLWGRPWLGGIYLWKWFTDSQDESGPTDFSPAGKPAEAVLEGYYRQAPERGGRGGSAAAVQAR
jgi:hypothetical protein